MNRINNAPGGRAAGKITFERKTGFHGMSPELRREAASRGGVTQGNIQGPKNRDSGQLDRIRNLPQTKAAQLEWSRSDVNRAAMREIGLIQGPKTDFSRIRTTESCKLGAERGSGPGRHSRWHRKRLLFNPVCPQCKEAKTNGENWWLAEYVQKDPRSWTGRRRKKKN
jgi:hypothetical protein